MKLKFDSNKIPSIVAGYIAFGTVTLTSTLIQHNLGISTGTRTPIPTIVGVGSVIAASYISQRASVDSYELWNKYFSRSKEISSIKKNSKRHKSILSSTIPLSTIQVCGLGLITFKLLGGRFWSLSPSSYTSLGSFARASLPATEKYATSAERLQIQQIGKKWGCHTCGYRAWFSKITMNFHADHMPPIAAAKQMNSKLWRRVLNYPVKQRFYPQCISCSNNQGKILSQATAELKNNAKIKLYKAGAGKLAYFHGMKFRMFHFTGAIIATYSLSDHAYNFVGSGFEKLEKIGEKAKNYLRRNKE